MSLRGGAKRAWYAVFRVPPDELIDRWVPFGKVLIPLLSKERIARLQRDILVNDTHRGLVDRLIKRELTRRYYASSEDEQRAINRASIWGGEAGDRWHEARRLQYGDDESFAREYLRRRAAAIAQLQDLCSAPAGFEELCEIGTGNGMFLDYLSRHLQGIDRFVGIDLSAGQIAQNRKVYAGSRLEFLHVEASEYVQQNGTRPTIFLSAGTFECFTESELRQFLALLVDRPSATAVVLIEPVNIDLERVLESRPRGGLLFSHNYPHLLAGTGFVVRELDLLPIEGSGPHCNQVTMTATHG